VREKRKRRRRRRVRQEVKRPVLVVKDDYEI
jgi:hypothetical protein